MEPTVLLAGPVTHRARVHVNEATLEVEPDPTDLLILRPGVQRLGGDARDVEVDGVAVGVLAIAGDLVALLAQQQIILRVAEPGDYDHAIAPEVFRRGNQD